MCEPQVSYPLPLISKTSHFSRQSCGDRCKGIIIYRQVDNSLMYRQYPPDICFYSLHQTQSFLECCMYGSSPGVGLTNELVICKEYFLLYFAMLGFFKQTNITLVINTKRCFNKFPMYSVFSFTANGP